MKKFILIICTIVFCIVLDIASPSAEASYKCYEISEGQENIIKRAKQLAEIEWIPLYDRYMWGYGGMYWAGETYIGIPYGQPVYVDGYIGFDVSLDEFIDAVSEWSEFYNSYSYYNNIAPLYSADCSSFLSYAWDLDYRVTTSDIPNIAYEVKDQNIDAMQVGDCLNKAGAHVVLISEVKNNINGDVVSIEIMEQSVYGPQITIYGEDEEKTFENLEYEYFDNGYILYRYGERDSVTYSHNCTVPLVGDKCLNCGAGICDYSDVCYKDWYSKAVYYVSNEGLFVGTGNSKFSPEIQMTEGMFLTVLARLSDENGNIEELLNSDNLITREEICELLYSYAKLNGIALPRVYEKTLFTDDAEISYSAKTAVYTMQRAGIIDGMDGGNFEPKEYATRAQVAQIIMKFMSI